MCALYDYDTDLTDGQWELIEPLLPERTWQLMDRHCRDRNTARATLGKGLAVSAFPRYVPV